MDLRNFAVVLHHNSVCLGGSSKEGLFQAVCVCVYLFSYLQLRWPEDCQRTDWLTGAWGPGPCQIRSFQQFHLSTNSGSFSGSFRQRAEELHLSPLPAIWEWFSCTGKYWWQHSYQAHEQETQIQWASEGQPDCHANRCAAAYVDGSFQGTQ